MASVKIPKPLRHIESGTTGSVTVSANSSSTKTISFNNDFSNNDYVIILTLNSNNSDSGFGAVSASFYGKTVSGFSMKIFNNSNAEKKPTVQWVAMEG